MNVAGALAERWRQWRHGSVVPPARWVVLDTETSGLDPSRDTLLSIGAVAVDAQGVRLRDSFEVVLRNDDAGDRDNIVVHGIGYGAQREGVPPPIALQALVEYLDGAPCVGFHCAFDQAVLARAARDAGVVMPAVPWLDVAMLAGTLEPARQRAGARSLDEWLAAFAITMAERHNAAADALVTAELLLRLRAGAPPSARLDHAALVRLSRQQRWLAPGG